MSASHVPADIDFLIFCTFSPAFKKFEVDLSIAEDAPMVSKGETVVPNSNSFSIFLTSLLFRQSNVFLFLFFVDRWFLLLLLLLF